MRRLQDLSAGHKIALTMIIVLAILFAIALYGYLTGAWDKAIAQQREVQLYGGLPLDAVLIKLDKRALDTAYEQRVIKLWEVWLSPTTKDMTSFTTGLKTARQRYGEAAAAIAHREQQLQERQEQK